ncbi:MAG: SagB/ThcOx family dehydrogenase [Bacteroidales bacterium]|nr:SagB/ThcOx family dehydrogenase [Bacteroidales bacterium]
MKKIFLLNFVLVFLLNIKAQEVIVLPKPQTQGGMPLMEALSKRKSMRNFDSNKSFNNQMLSNLLWAANGINRPELAKRTAPSAVNWQQIEIYVAIKEGVYYYNYLNHSLELVEVGDYRKEMGKQIFVGDASAVLVYVADIEKMEGASEKAIDFYSATDCGNVCQNVYLFSASEGLATVEIGMIDREQIAKRLKIKEKTKVILSQPVGYSK